MPVPHHLVFTGQMPFLPPNEQRQSNERKLRLQCFDIIHWGRKQHQKCHSPIPKDLQHDAVLLCRLKIAA